MPRLLALWVGTRSPRTPGPAITLATPTGRALHGLPFLPNALLHLCQGFWNSLRNKLLALKPRLEFCPWGPRPEHASCTHMHAQAHARAALSWQKGAMATGGARCSQCATARATCWTRDQGFQATRGYCVNRQERSGRSRPAHSVTFPLRLRNIMFKREGQHMLFQKLSCISEGACDC